MEKVLREKKNKNAAEEAARTDLTQEQMAEVRNSSKHCVVLACETHNIDNVMEHVDKLQSV
jgi:metal-dependent hydrolase (beta-lactamase superfamily II)